MAVIDNLISYWPLNENAGDVGLDAHGSNQLSDNNTVGAGTGKVSGARDFESGSNHFLSRADNADLSTGDIDFSLQAWVNIESIDFRGIVGKWGSTATEYLLYLDNTDSLFKFLVNDGSSNGTATASTFGTVSLATWYLVHCWHDSVNNLIGISVNAGTADTQSWTTGVQDAGQQFDIGSQAFPWDGLIDEVALWKKVLTPEERTWLYNSDSGRSYADIVAEAGGATPTIQPPVRFVRGKRRNRMRRAT